MISGSQLSWTHAPSTASIWPPSASRLFFIASPIVMEDKVLNATVGCQKWDEICIDGLFNYWFPLVRPATKPLFLGGSLGGVGWWVIMYCLEFGVYVCWITQSVKMLFFAYKTLVCASRNHSLEHFWTFLATNCKDHPNHDVCGYKGSNLTR